MNPDTSTLIGYTLLAASSLFVIVDPIATVPAFLAMTAHDTPGQRIRMALVAEVEACLEAAQRIVAFTRQLAGS